MKYSAQNSGRAGRGSIGIFWPFIAAVTAASALVVLAAVRNSSSKVVVKNRDGSELSVNISRLGDARLIDLKTKSECRLRTGSSPCLVIFFSPADCPSCLQEVAVWQRLSSDYDKSHLRVVGIALRGTLAESLTFAKAYSPSFDLYLDQNRDVESLVGIPSTTPFKVLIDSGGRVLLADGPNPDQAEQQEFGRKVDALIRSH